jgi:hypothetical protein
MELVMGLVVLYILFWGYRSLWRDRQTPETQEGPTPGGVGPEDSPIRKWAAGPSEDA